MVWHGSDRAVHSMGHQQLSRRVPEKPVPAPLTRVEAALRDQQLGEVSAHLVKVLCGRGRAGGEQQ